MKRGDPVIIVSVVRDPGMYARCIADNPHVRRCTLRPFDNRELNETVPTLYNRFLEAWAYEHPAWFVFCHEDFEPLQPLAPLLAQASMDCLHGPIGAVTERLWGFVHVWRLRGEIRECGKDGQAERSVGSPVPTGTTVETFDCQCLIVHSDLVLKTGLRFDAALSFDLYVEDFCIQAKERFAVPSLILPIACKHWSSGTVGERYRRQEAYLRLKYRGCCYTGTSSYAIGTPTRLRTVNVAVKRFIRAALRPFAGGRP